jgi:hypothetical protein
MENKTVEIWIRGRKLCEISEDTEAIEYFEQLVKRAGLFFNEKEEGNKIIKMV